MSAMPIVLHHLNNSRSQRILWLLEELSVPYELRVYQRDAVTNLAPPELKAVHPLGKSPLLEVDGRIIEEFGGNRAVSVRDPWRRRLAPGGGYGRRAAAP